MSTPETITVATVESPCCGATAGPGALVSLVSLVLRLAFGGMDWGHGIEGEVALWAKNLGNVARPGNIIDFGPGFANLRVANFDQPRTFGVSVTARW